MARRFALPTYSSTSLSLKTINFEELVLSGLPFLILSIDGATSTTYLQFRRNGNFALVIDNIDKLVAAKTRLNSYTPVLHWQFLVFEHNVHEVEEVKKLAAALGVNQLSLVNTLFRRLGRSFHFNQGRSVERDTILSLQHGCIQGGVGSDVG